MRFEVPKKQLKELKERFGKNEDNEDMSYLSGIVVFINVTEPEKSSIRIYTKYSCCDHCYGNTYNLEQKSNE